MERKTHLRHGEFQTIVRHRVGSEDQGLEVQLLVTEDLPQRFPVVFLVLLALVAEFCASRRDVHELQETGLIGLEPTRCAWRVGQ